MALRTLSLCTGYGGLELALRDVFGEQVRTVCYVEWETYAAATLMARMEEQKLDKAPIWDDLTTFDGKPWSGKVDIITAGFPCQPVSNAGKRATQDDERWIWPDIYRIICEIRPKFVFLENVAGLLSGGLDFVLGDLAEGRYDAEWTSIKANEIGASHNRLRVFILANTGSRRLDWRPRADGKGIELPVQANRSCSELENTSSKGLERGHSHGDDTQTTSSGNKLANTKSPRFQSCNTEGSRPKRSISQTESKSCTMANTKHNEHIEQKQGSDEKTIRDNEERKDKSIESSGVHRTGDVDESEQGFISTWFPPGPDESELWKWLLVQRPEIKPSFCRIHDGIADQLVKPFRTERLTMLGNGVVPQQASAAFKILWERMYK